MKTLIIGFLVFSGWTVMSTYIYVCKIKGFCAEKEYVMPDTNPADANSSGNTLVPQIPAQEEIPGPLVMYFEFDKSDFNPNEESEKYFNESNSYLVRNTRSKLSITGHTDGIGTEEYNQELGFRRSMSMRLYFEKKGIPADNILIESKGEKEPADDNSTSKGRANNRRTVITINK